MSVVKPVFLLNLHPVALNFLPDNLSLTRPAQDIRSRGCQSLDPYLLTLLAL